MESTTVTRPVTDAQPPAQSSSPEAAPTPRRRWPVRLAVAVAGRLDALTGGRASRIGRIITGPQARALARSIAQQVRTNLRLPDRDTPTPHPVRLAGICVWAALLGLTGLLVAGRIAVAVVAGTAPGWFEPVVITLGGVGIVLTICAFAAIHRPRVPWLLLASATLPLVLNGLLAFSL
ncbi:MAG TPA: hypothetical protein VKZ67_05070 [Natronosporangium sp.]|nr:hypothetical protein [Natronosporangium sp.]